MLKPEKLVPFFASVNLTATCMLTKHIFKQNSVRVSFWAHILVFVPNKTNGCVPQKMQLIHTFQ